jgi:hypothetical protein
MDMFRNYTELRLFLAISTAKASLYLIKYYAKKKCWEMEVYVHRFLTSAHDETECSDSFTSGERVTVTTWIQDWMAATDGLGALGRRKIS